MNIQDIINRLSKEDIAKLNEIHDDFSNNEDPSYQPHDVVDIIANAVDRFVDDWIDVIGTNFRDTYKCDTIEIILVECGNGWLPSVRSRHWDAPASTIDPELAVDNPRDALAWGIIDALTEHVIEKGIN
jgi:hypothetical protein